MTFLNFLLDAQIADSIKDYILINSEHYMDISIDRKELESLNYKLFRYIDSKKLITKEFKFFWKKFKIFNPNSIHILAFAAESNDKYLAGHLYRIGRYSTLLAEKMGISKWEINNIGKVAPLHDIGKLGIPNEILLKPGKLTNEEFTKIQTHSVVGANLLMGARSEIMQLAWEIAYTHHEKWDGTGYPNGLKGNEIPITGQIIGLLDAFDAMTSEKPYKPVYPDEIAWDYIQFEKGEQFSPDVVDVFLENYDEFLKIKNEI